MKYLHTYDYWNNKPGNVKENVSCASSGIHLLNICETSSQKLGSSVKYLLWHQNKFGMD